LLCSTPEMIIVPWQKAFEANKKIKIKNRINFTINSFSSLIASYITLVC